MSIIDNELEIELINDDSEFKIIISKDLFYVIDREENNPCKDINNIDFKQSMLNIRREFIKK